MNLRTTINTIRQMLNPSRLPVLFDKVMQRLFDKQQVNNQENLQWLAAQKQDFADYAKSLDEALWAESLEYAESLKEHGDEVLSQLDVTLGGGGFYPLIYFVTRHRKPGTILETGVAAGYSSHAFLSALEKNTSEGNSGNLYSSDFPYFRIENPEKYIGILVPEQLKSRWNLFIDGDAKNLPKIMAKVESVDLFHYDSDKRYAGREQAMKYVGPKLSKDAVVIMDDINDNRYFMEMCQSQGKAFRIFEFEGKYIGMLGELSPAEHH